MHVRIGSETRKELDGDPTWRQNLEAARTALEDAHARRDRLIIEAATADVPRSHIADAVGLSRAQVHRIIKDAG